LVVKSFLFVPDRNSAGLIRPILPVGWTLQFEMLFYLVFAIAIAAGLSRLVWCLVVFIGFYFSRNLLSDNVIVDFYSQSIVFEFLLGLVIAHLVSAYRNTPIVIGVVFLLIGSTLAFVIPWPDDADRLLTLGVGAFFVVYGLLIFELNGWFLAFFEKTKILGDISYSTYLCHTFVVPAVPIAFKFINNTNYSLILCGSIIVAFIASFMSYFWIEKPLIKLANKILLNKNGV
jgi:exopolysaccharide production protein ExoZ